MEAMWLLSGLPYWASEWPWWKRNTREGFTWTWGCIPTKALLRNAEVVGLLQKGEAFGFTMSGYQVGYAVAVDRSRKVAEGLAKGVSTLI